MFPGPEHQRDPVNIFTYHLDEVAIKLCLDALPDPVVARMTHMCDLKVQPILIRALGPRVDLIGISMIRESYPDRDKDLIVFNAVTKVVNQLIKQGRITKKGADYYGKVFVPAKK